MIQNISHSDKAVGNSLSQGVVFSVKIGYHDSPNEKTGAVCRNIGEGYT
jgi:hypothetical protein